MHTRPNVYMDEVLLAGSGGKSAPKFQHYLHQSATSINNNNNNQNNINSMNMRNRQRKWRVLLSIGLLLPALAAIIGIVAWTISIEVTSANEAMSSQKTQNHQNNHHHHHHLHHKQHSHHSSHPSHPQQQQFNNQNEQPSKRHLQQQPSIALPQQAAETKSESQACATLVLTNLKQQLDSNSDNIENRASKPSSSDVPVNDDTSSYETDEQHEPQAREQDPAQQQQADATTNQSGNANEGKQTSQQPSSSSSQQQDDDSSYEAIASAISTTLNANGGKSQPAAESALSANAPAKRTTGENVADVIDHLVSRRRQAMAANSNKARASRIVVVAPMDDSMKARSQVKQVEASSEEKGKEALSEPSARGPSNLDEHEQERGEEQEERHESSSAEESDTRAKGEAAGRRSSSAVDQDQQQEPAIAIDRGDWVPAWPLRRNILESDDQLSIHVSSKPKEARARSRRQEVNPSVALERLSKRQNASSRNGPDQSQPQPKLYSTEQIIRDHVIRSKSSRYSSSQPVGETTHEKQSEQQNMMMTMKRLASPSSQQQEQQPPRQQRPDDASRQQPQQQQQQKQNALWQQQQLARLAGSQQHHHAFRPQHVHDHMIGSSSSLHQQQQQVPQFFSHPNHRQLFNPNPSHLNYAATRNQPHLHPHLQPQPQPQQLFQQQQQQQQQQPSVLHTTEHHFLLSPSQFQNFMNSPLFQQAATRRQQVASSRNGVEPAVAPPVSATANKPSDTSPALRAMRSLVTSSQSAQPGIVIDQEPQSSEMMRSMRYLTNGAPIAGGGADGLVISEQQQQQQQQEASLASAGSEPRAQMAAAAGQAAGGEGPTPDQEVQESYGQMPAYHMPEGYGGGGGGGGPHYQQGGYGGSDQDKKSKGITFHFGGGPIGGGTQLITSPMGIFKHLMIPLMPNPRVNLNGKVVFGVVLEKSTAFGSPPKKRKYKFWGR